MALEQKICDECGRTFTAVTTNATTCTTCLLRPSRCRKDEVDEDLVDECQTHDYDVVSPVVQEPQNNDLPIPPEASAEPQDYLEDDLDGVDAIDLDSQLKASQDGLGEEEKNMSSSVSHCENCGEPYVKSGRNQKYCDDCRSKIGHSKPKDKDMTIKAAIKEQNTPPLSSSEDPGSLENRLGSLLNLTGVRQIELDFGWMVVSITRSEEPQ